MPGIDALSTDVLGFIFGFLTSHELPSVLGTCKLWRRILKKYIGNYHFNMKPWYKTLKDDHLKPFKGVGSIDMSFCYNITDKGLSHLQCSNGLHTIKLAMCSQITDQGLKHLVNAHTLDLFYCTRITDEGLKHLRKVHIIDITYCHKITERGLQILRNINPNVKIYKSQVWPG